MQSQEALAEFFRSFKISLNLASLYPKDHPYFLKSIADLKLKTDEALQFVDTLKISATATALLLNAEPPEKAGASQEIVNMLHLRKIKTIEIKRGAALNELACLLGAICLKPKEIFRSGGIGRILQSQAVDNILAEELDYSLLLKEKGEEIKDIWVYLLKDATEKQDAQKFAQLSENFSGMAENFRIDDLFEDEELRASIVKFFDYLKKNQNSRLLECQKAILDSLLKAKAMPKNFSLEKIKELFKDLNSQDLADALLGQITADKNFDSNNFSLFLQLTGKDKQNQIASSLAKNLENDRSLKDNPALLKKIQGLFSVPDNQYVSGAYRSRLSGLLAGISYEDKYVFDRSALRKNYRLILLGLLSPETSAQKSGLILKRLTDEFKEIMQNKDWQYLEKLCAALKQKASVSAGNTAISETSAKLSDLLEDSIWNEQDENKINADALRLYLEFFPERLGIFKDKLKRESADLKLLALIIENLKAVKGKTSLEVLKHIYAISHNLIKAEVLKAMQNLGECDADFLLPIIGGDDVFLKREALNALRSDKAALARALDLMFSKSALLMKNIDLVDELGIREARGHILVLSRKRFFWNTKLRNRARNLLEKWGN